MNEIEIEFTLFWLCHFRLTIKPPKTVATMRQPDNVIHTLIEELQDGSKPATKNNLKKDA